MRDVQANRVYRAEDTVWQGDEFGSWDEIVGFANDVLQDPWFEERYGDYFIEVALSGDDTGSYAYRCKGGRGRRGRIEMGKDHWYPLIVLHEMTHIIVGPKYTDHGIRFCHTYLELVGRNMGANVAVALTRAFEREGVRFRRRRYV